MGKKTVSQFLTSLIATITIEPSIFLNGFGQSMVRYVFFY